MRHPQQARHADRPERDLPAAAEMLDEFGVQWDQDGRGRRAALEDAVAQRPVLQGEDLPRGDERARPVPGLEDAEHRSPEEQPAEGSRAGFVVRFDSSQPVTSALPANPVAIPASDQPTSTSG